MKIALIQPSKMQTARGNLATVRRWLSGLKNLGHEVQCISASEAPAILRQDSFDIVHAHHAHHSGLIIAQSLATTSQPWLVSLGGTDLHESESLERAEQLQFVVENAHGVIGCTPAEKDKLSSLDLNMRAFHLVRRGVEIPASEPEALSWSPSDNLKVLFLGGIRPVKAPRMALLIAEALHRAKIPLTLEFVGPAIDDEEVLAFRNALKATPVVSHWRGQVSEPKARQAIRDSHVLLNTSTSEGAANAILEALVEGRLVVARDNLGNRAMLKNAPKSCCLIYRDDHFDEILEFLKNFGNLRAQEQALCTQAGRQFIADHHDSRDEIRDLIQAYTQTIQNSKEA